MSACSAHWGRGSGGPMLGFGDHGLVLGTMDCAGNPRLCWDPQVSADGLRLALMTPEQQWRLWISAGNHGLMLGIPG